MTPTPEVERAAAEAIDAANAEDPTSLLVDGVEVPTQLLLGRLASEWVGRLDPGASASQRIAARGHHLRRWESPRSDYPAGRAGYLRWRRDQKARHAADLAGLLTGVGWSAAAATRVGEIVRKEGLGRDPEVQTHEDAVCLAFLEAQLDAAAQTMGDETSVTVLRRTAKKMSERAVAAAGALPLSDHGRSLLIEALSEPA